MSDLQDVIAANAVKAYNEGFARGEASEQERILEIVDAYQTSLCRCDVCRSARGMVETIKGEQK